MRYDNRQAYDSPMEGIHDKDNGICLLATEMMKSFSVEVNARSPHLCDMVKMMSCNSQINAAMDHKIDLVESPTEISSSSSAINTA